SATGRTAAPCMSPNVRSEAVECGDVHSPRRSKEAARTSLRLRAPDGHRTDVHAMRARGRRVPDVLPDLEVRKLARAVPGAIDAEAVRTRPAGCALGVLRENAVHFELDDAVAVGAIRLDRELVVDPLPREVRQCSEVELRVDVGPVRALARA